MWLLFKRQDRPHTAFSSTVIEWDYLNSDSLFLPYESRMWIINNNTSERLGVALISTGNIIIDFIKRVIGK